MLLGDASSDFKYYYLSGQLRLKPNKLESFMHDSFLMKQIGQRLKT